MLKRLHALRKNIVPFFNEKEFCVQKNLREHFYKDTRQHLKALMQLSNLVYNEVNSPGVIKRFPKTLFKNVNNNIIGGLFRQRFYRLLALCIFLILIWQVESYWDIMGEYMGYQFRISPVKFDDVLVLL